MLRTVVVGTAGHVDHGKSSLVRALTGTDPDRLKEEQERGITIDLGFAHLTRPSGLVLSFVDVPGHERFVRNMLAGASGLDLVVLVVAADESVMPQTREHLDICRLLGVRAGLVAITKCDLVDDDTIELVKLEVIDLVAGTFLEGASMVACSSASGAGLDILLAELESAAARAQPRPVDAPFRLPLDRVFTLHGFGTVVTGTATSGRVSVGDELEILPGARRVRVRGVQVHGEASEAGEAGHRVAVNLGGIDHHELQRGHVAVTPGSHVESVVLDVSVNLLPDSPDLADLSRVRLHIGTAEVLARIRWARGEEPGAGGSSVGQLRLEGPVVAAAGDRFILRRYSPVTTIGGGRVLHPSPPLRLRRSDAARAAALEAAAQALGSGDLADLNAHLVEAAGDKPVLEAQVAAWTGASQATTRLLLDAGVAAGRLVVASEQPRALMATSAMVAAECRVVERLKAFHAAEPLQPGMPKNALVATSGLPEAAFAALLARAELSGRLKVTRDLVAATGHVIKLTPEEKAARDILVRVLEQGGLAPPDLAVALEMAGLSPAKATRLLKLLVTAGELVRVKDSLYFHGRVMAKLLSDMTSWLAPGATFGVPDFKDKGGISRKHAIPLLEYLDAQGYTRRVGDARQWIGRVAQDAAGSVPAKPGLKPAEDASQ